jgi:hypothetical protein
MLRSTFNPERKTTRMEKVDGSDALQAERRSFELEGKRKFFIEQISSKEFAAQVERDISK